jgi:hypothetical protein
MKSRQRRGALDGKEFGFAVRDVFLRGQAVVREGTRVGRPAGRMVRPARFR